MKRPVEHLIVVAIVLVLIAVALAVTAYSGIYDIGADDHHWSVALRLLQFVRDRSIRGHSEHLTVASLDDPRLALKGAGQYAAMCTGCHLAPGVEDSEMRSGLYPQPPNLSEVRIEPRRAFWVIKHGIKMSGMPAWGVSHDDRTIWSIVAFLQELPRLTPQQYRDIVATAPQDEDMKMGAGRGQKHDE